jgi:hypothetical protein
MALLRFIFYPASERVFVSYLAARWWRRVEIICFMVLSFWWFSAASQTAAR